MRPPASGTASCSPIRTGSTGSWPTAPSAPGPSPRPRWPKSARRWGCADDGSPTGVVMDALQPNGRERRLLDALLVLGVVVLFFLAVGLVADAIYYFGDILLAFFLAWLLAFIISPIVSRIVDLIPALPRVFATVMVYTLIVIILVVVVLVA